MKAKRYVGISGFAMLHPKFPIKRFLRQYPDDIKAPATAVLVDYFGRRAANLKLFVDKFEDRPHLIEFHLGFRSYPLADTERRCKELRRILGVIGIVCLPGIWMAPNANISIIICPILEDSLSSFHQWQEYAKIVRKYFPGIPLVRSTLKGDKRGGRYQEIHGTHPRFSRPPLRCIANPDGVSINYGGEKYDKQMSPQGGAAYLKRYEKCFLRLTWSADQQGLGGTHNFNKPPVADRQYVVTDAAIKWHRENLK